MTKQQHRLFQVDTYKAANGVFKELLEQKLSEITTHPEWWTTITQEWEGAYNDFGPPVHTWILSDRSEEEVLAIARTVCPHAEIGDVSDPATCKADLIGLLCAARPKRYKDIQITEEELHSRLAIEDWSYYLSYGPKGWQTWWMDRIRALEEEREWNPDFPTEIKFSRDKLFRLFQVSEKLQNIWELELEVPSQDNLLAMIDIPELIQIAKFECDIEFPEEEEGIDGEALLDMILWKLDDQWKVSARHNPPQLKVIFRDPGMHDKEVEVANIRQLASTLQERTESYATAQVYWGDIQLYFWHEISEKQWHGSVCHQP